MKKQLLLKKLEEALRHAESTTSIYLEHLRAIVERLSNNHDLLKELRLTFNFLIDSNRFHRTQCQHLIEKIKKEKSNDI